MSFETIKIYRQLPVIDGFVQVPPNRESDKTRITADSLYDTAPSKFTRIRLSGGSGGNPPGTGRGQQELVELEGITPDAWYESDLSLIHI